MGFKACVMLQVPHSHGLLIVVIFLIRLFMSDLISILEYLNLKLKCERPCCNSLKLGTLQQTQ